MTQNVRSWRCVMLTFAIFSTASAIAQPRQLDPSMSDWIYRQYADVDTGKMTPGAGLMSTADLPLSDKRPGEKRYAYLAVRVTLSKSIESAFSVDSIGSDPRAGACDPDTCSLKIRFGSAQPQLFLAREDPRGSHTYVLKDSRTFLEIVAKHSGPIEVQYQDLNKRTLRFQFMAAKPLQPSRLPTR